MCVDQRKKILSILGVRRQKVLLNSQTFVLEHRFNDISAINLNQEDSPSPGMFDIA